MSKKLMMLAAAVAALFCAWSETETVGDYTWTYRINGDTAEIYNSGSRAISPSPTGAVTIPSTLGGKSVTSIGSSAFSGCSGLTSVTIPNGVTSIGSYAFCDCSGLTSVTIPDSVTSIGYKAFHYTPLYNGQPDGLVVFGKIVYWMKGTCPASVTIPDSVTGIGSSAFDGRESLKSVTIPNSVTSIGNSAFKGCRGLASVTIGNGVTSIGDRAFYNCSGLTSMTIPNSVASIGDEAFYNCTSLQLLTIPDSVTSYGVNCFEGCPAFYRAVFGGGLGGVAASVVTTVVQQVEAPYTLTNAVADRAIASVTVNADCAIDSFVLKDGNVYDTMLYVNNTADHAVRLSLPPGYAYKTIKGATPLTIPASSQCIISITRVDANVLLVMREELDDVK